MKLPIFPMEQEFHLSSLDDDSKRELENPLHDSIACCQDPREVNTLFEDQFRHQIANNQRVIGAEQPLQFSNLDMMVGSVPGRRTVVLSGGATAEFSPDCHGIPPSPPSVVAAIPTEGHPVLQPDGRINPLLDESMQMWLANSHQPLDLRSDISDSENWIIRRSGPYGEMLSTVDQTVQQQQQKINGYNIEPGSTSSSAFLSDDSLEDVPSPSFRSSLMDRTQPSTEDLLNLNESSLISLSVRDLNRRLHGYPRDLIQKIKQRRRTLKNRGYAQNCRHKRIAQKSELELNNRSLQDQLRKLMEDIETERREKELAYKERDYYKQQIMLSRARNCSATLPTGLSNNTSNPNAEDFFL